MWGTPAGGLVEKYGMASLLRISEAAAMGLPTISTDATGARDAFKDGETGIQVPVRDAGRLAAAIERLARDAELRRTMGAAGRRWVAEHFEQQRMWADFAEEYRRLAGAPRRSRTATT